MTATPFTVEEARNYAATLSDSSSRITPLAISAEQMAATLRKYAQMCEAIAEIEHVANDHQQLGGITSMNAMLSIRTIVERLSKEE